MEGTKNHCVKPERVKTSLGRGGGGESSQFCSEHAGLTAVKIPVFANIAESVPALSSLHFSQYPLK